MGTALAARLAGEDQKAREYITKLLNSGSAGIDADSHLTVHDSDE